ncbi:hypothetical protein BKA56DRAFT_581457 [Ilyonectria sp. MPI-CAGE-AT-0026]|nr:hypothetical protein BKA56DRAFT_581457 [Ilyonectria sp. MPI-CAGE-AT-0026]
MLLILNNSIARPLSKTPGNSHFPSHASSSRFLPPGLLTRLFPRQASNSGNAMFRGSAACTAPVPNQ